VRGLEAVTLCFPPTAESIVKEKTIKQIFNGKRFKAKGYKVFIWWRCFFDNMEDFFSGNGYDIVDKKTFNPTKLL
jgi:hypothetical protein